MALRIEVLESGNGDRSGRQFGTPTFLLRDHIMTIEIDIGITVAAEVGLASGPDGESACADAYRGTWSIPAPDLYCDPMPETGGGADLARFAQAYQVWWLTP